MCRRHMRIMTKLTYWEKGKKMGELLEKQYDIQQAISNTLHINTVTCGQCGEAFFINMNLDPEEGVICPRCLTELNWSDCLDLFKKP